MMRFIATIVLIHFFIYTFGQATEAFFQAVVAYESNKTEEAIAQFSNCIHLGIEPAKSYFYQGKAYMDRKDYQLAELDFIKSLELNINESAIELAKLYSKIGNYSASIKYLNKYINSNPKLNPNTIFKDPELAKLRDSDAWFDFIADFKPSEKWEWVAETNYLLNKKCYQEAHSKIDEALALFQDEACLHELKANIYTAEENYTLANYEMSQAVKCEPENTDILIKAASFAMENKQYNNACLYFEKAKEQVPEQFNISLDLAKAYALSGKNELAQAEIEYFIKLFPHNTQAVLQQAGIYYTNGQYTLSLKTINKLFATDGTIKPEWYLLRGKTYYKTGILKYAAEDLAMCLDLVPNSLDGNYYLGLTHYKIGNKELSCYYFDRAYRLGDDRPLKHIQTTCRE